MTDYASLEAMQAWAADMMASRPPDQVIGDDPLRLYMRRWFVTPRSPHANVYLHQILRSDDDRALHDHPADNRSLVIAGGYWEHHYDGVILWRAPGWAGDRKADMPHRLELDRDDAGREMPCVSLFIMGPKYREWGFHCDDGWRHWRDFEAMGGC